MINRFQKEFDREIKIMLKLKHNNIVEIIGQCPQKSESEYFWRFEIKNFHFLSLYIFLDKKYYVLLLAVENLEWCISYS